VVRRPYVPGAGDIVWAFFDPQAGHEQSGRRPAFVLTASMYNEKAGLALACPITSKIKGYPFEVAVSGRRIQGVILSDQIRSLDWRSRQFMFIERADDETMEAVKQSLNALLQFS
jgi:mRNA interferase MazF